MVKFLDLPGQYESIRREIDEAIHHIVSTGSFVGGAAVRDFEAAFSEYQNTDHCVGVANGTDAIEIALEGLRLPKGSEIVVPANSFIATSEAVTRAGHRVVFCDVDPFTLLMDIKDLRERLTSATAAVICVHLYGSPCDMGEILDLARERNLRVIEDCAQAHGAEWRGQRVGSFGDAGTFSFYPGKTLGAFGDAGAIVTGSPELASRCRMIANHGRVSKYDHEFEGRNSRLDSLQAAVLQVKLRHLDGWIDARNDVAAQYRSGLRECEQVSVQQFDDQSRHGYHLFVVRAQRRDELRSFLHARGIETGIHYPISLPRLAAYAHLVRAGESFMADGLAGELLSLPIGEHVSANDAEEVIDSVRDFYHS